MNNTPETRSTLRVHLIRNAETESDAAGTVSGPEDRLSTRGLARTDALSSYFHRYPLRVDALYCSTLRRSQQTLEGIRAALDTPPVEPSSSELTKNLRRPQEGFPPQDTFNAIMSGFSKGGVTIMEPVERLREIDRGRHEGRPASSVYTPDEVRKMRHLGMDHRFPRGESMNDVAERMHRWLQGMTVVAQKYRWNSVVAVTHDMAIKCLLHQLFNLDPRTTWLHKIDHASITTLERVGEDWCLIRFNATPHFPFEW